jgi:phosphatidylglycerophosphatase A
MTRLIATVGFVGLLRPAPGTWGSLAALPLAWGLHALGGFGLFFAATLAMTALGYWATTVQTRDSADKDPAEIVVDELAGQWVALWPVSAGATAFGVAFSTLWPGILAAFIAFRAFDILKPGPVGWADRQTGAFGVMADDIIAGWLAAMVVGVLAVLGHLPAILSG